LATRRKVEAAIDDPQQILLDSRSALEFNGERFGLWARARMSVAQDTCPARSTCRSTSSSHGGAFREPGEIRAALAESGISPQQTVIAYCTIGNRASQAWFALGHLLGFPDVLVYYLSWVEWGRRTDTPIEV
jgi:thiosulfate/3-mercaptopyruvate sulfurtransferase